MVAGRGDGGINATKAQVFTELEIEFETSYHSMFIIKSV